MILDKPLDTAKRSRLFVIIGPSNDMRFLMETAYEIETLTEAFDSFFKKDCSDESISLWNNPVPPHPAEQFCFPKSRILTYVISAPPSGLVIAESAPRKPIMQQ